MNNRAGIWTSFLLIAIGCSEPLTAQSETDQSKDGTDIEAEEKAAPK